jgi:hypothetical protein
MAAREVEKDLVKEAMREALDELAVTYTQGAVKFANALTDAMANVVNAWDDFFVTNLAEDRPELARTVIDARISAARRAKELIEDKIAALDQLAVMPSKARRQGGKSGSRAPTRRTTKR